jgi:hypothetical protein
MPGLPTFPRPGGRDPVTRPHRGIFGRERAKDNLGGVSRRKVNFAHMPPEELDEGSAGVNQL